MKIPFGWLKDYVDIGRMRPDKIAHYLTMAGLEVVLIEKVGGDFIFDIEVTPNRPDCLCITGIAREVAAVLQKRFKDPLIKPIKPDIRQKAVVVIRDRKHCPRYTARIIKGVKIGPSPKWLVDKIKKMGLRPVNNVVDLTNYCLFELGQPTHAFDLDKLKGKIIIRHAKQGEKIVTIDGKARFLNASMLVIADEEKPVALGGIMGSKDTEVTEATENILFESAYFDPVSIRRTSRMLGLVSESSYRFERSVNIGGIVSASDRCCRLIKELCGGKIGPLVDVGKRPFGKVKVYLRPERLYKVLGVEIPLFTIKKILLSLGLKVEISSKNSLVVSIPYFRQDLKAEVDLIEEIIRIYGYDRLPSTMPTIVGHSRRIEPIREYVDITRECLISLGIDEVITYSLISRGDAESVELQREGEEDLVVIKNPLSTEQEVMRPTIVPGVLRAVCWNLNKGINRIRLFEIGKTYHRQQKGFREAETVVVAFVPQKDKDWKSRDVPLFFEMKGVFETLLRRLGIEDILFKNEGLPPFLSGIGASIEVSDKKIGFLGQVKKDLLNRFDIKTEVFLGEISLAELSSFIKLEKMFKRMPRFPSAKRDVSLVVDKGVSHQSIISVIKEAGGDLVANVELFDQYFGAQIPKDKRGLSYTIEYRAEDRTLTDGEVNRLHSEILSALTKSLEAKIR